MTQRIIALVGSLVVMLGGIAVADRATAPQPFRAQAIGGGNPSCEAAIDMLLVLDGSGSIFARDFRTMQSFSQDLAGSFVISPAGAHVGVVQFSGEGQGRLEIGLSSDAAAVKTAIDNMVQIEGFTDIQEGIQLGQGEIAAHSRPGVPHILIVLTDGQQEGAPGDPVAEAQSARNAGTEIFAIGVGGGPHLDQLNAIASDPDAGHVFSVENFDGLASVLNQLVANTCPPSTPPTPSPSQPPAATPTATVSTPELKDDPSSCTAISFGLRISNVAISPAGDWDYYCFAGTAGQTIAADVDAEVDGSALDPVLTLIAPDGTTVLAQNDDWDGLDSHLEHRLPANDRYFLRVESYDHPCCGGPDHTYSLLLTKLSAAPTATATRTPARTATPTPRRLMGDANCDGHVNSIDAALVLQYDAGLIHSLPCPDLADVNQDSRINSLDASLILQYNAELLYRLPP